MLRVVELSNAPDAGLIPLPGVVIGVGSTDELSLHQSCLYTETFTLTEDHYADRRVTTVESVHDALAELRARCERWPHASGVCDDVLRAVRPDAAALAGVVTESLAYSTLQAGQEFARWLAERGEARVVETADPVLAERDGDTLRIRFNRPAPAQRVFHRCACRAARGTDGRAAGSVGDRDRVERQRSVVLQRRRSGRIRYFRRPGECSFGPHLAQSRQALDALTSRLVRSCRADVHGQRAGQRP